MVNIEPQHVSYSNILVLDFSKPILQIFDNIHQITKNIMMNNLLKYISINSILKQVNHTEYYQNHTTYN